MARQETPTTGDEQATNDAGFEAIVTAGTLEAALATLDALVEECVVELGEDGLHTTAVDPATVGFVQLDLGAGAFESYRASGGRIGVDLSRLLDVLGMHDDDAPVHLRLDPETRKLHLDAEGLSYTLALLDPDSIRSAPDPEDLDSSFTAGATLRTEQLTRAVRAADMVSDHVVIGAPASDGDETGMYVEAEGDTDDVRLGLEADDLLAFSPGEARSLFSIDYLSTLVSAIPAGAEVEARFGTETILELTSTVADGAGDVLYLLSPRMEV